MPHKPHALFAIPQVGITAPRVIFDTSEHPAEAGLYGDDIRLTSRNSCAGRRFLTLAGPEGEVELDQTAWRNVTEAMRLPRQEPSR